MVFSEQAILVTNSVFYNAEKVSEMKQKIPVFKDRQEERIFLEQNDSSEYIDWSEADSK